LATTLAPVSEWVVIILILTVLPGIDVADDESKPYSGVARFVTVYAEEGKGKAVLLSEKEKVFKIDTS